MCSEHPVQVVLGARVVTVPPGSYRLDRAGSDLDVTALDDSSVVQLQTTGVDVSELADIAARLGMRVSAQPEQVTKTEQDKPEQPATALVSRVSRPRDITTMVGQDTVRVQMRLETKAALTLRRHGKLDAMPAHTLLSGPPGTGKTTLARITAAMLGGRLVETTASAVKDVKVLARELMGLEDDDVLFIDEIHGLSRPAQELLYTAMEDGAISARMAEGAEPVALKRFVLVGATTIQGMLEAPMIARFGLVGTLTYYSEAELTEIILNAAASTDDKYECKIDAEDAAPMLAARAKGTPRDALNLLAKVRTFSLAMNDSPDVPINRDDVAEALKIHKIDSLGLDDDDRSILTALRKRYGQARGMSPEAIAAVTGLAVRTVKSKESLLLRLELLTYTDGGRQLTKRGYEHVRV